MSQTNEEPTTGHLPILISQPADRRPGRLLPCPFCGGEVTLEEAQPTSDPIMGTRKWWGVVCRNTINLGGTCAIQQRPSANEDAAIARWNMRNGLTAVPCSVLADLCNSLTEHKNRYDGYKLQSEREGNLQWAARYGDIADAYGHCIAHIESLMGKSNATNETRRGTDHE